MDSKIKGQLIYEIMCNPINGIFINSVTNGEVNSNNILDASMKLVLRLKKHMKINKILDGIINNVIRSNNINDGIATVIIPSFIPSESHFILNINIFNNNEVIIGYNVIKGSIDSEVILRLIVNMLNKAKKDVTKFKIMIEFFKVLLKKESI